MTTSNPSPDGYTPHISSSRYGGPAMERLTHEAEILRGAVEKLTAESKDQVERLTVQAVRTRRLVRWLICSLIVDLLLTVLMGVGEMQLRSVTHRLDVAQTTGRHQVLCPLYVLLLGLESPRARAAAPDPIEYDREFAVIRNGYTALHCDEG